MIVNIDLKKKSDLSYDIKIEPLERLEFDCKVAIVTNETVSKLHLDYLLQRVSAPTIEIIELQDGERYKTIESIMQILERLFEARFNRSSKIIAFGGGVIGDMSGFASSMFLRGVEFIQIPTTLLSQVDASVGGKTGVNSRYGKNLIGAFHQPKAVHIDISFLKTLPQREFSAGVAEILKMAITFDKEFFEWLEGADIGCDNTIEEVIVRSVQIKASVVAQDEREKGIRAALNYGHTFAHVIESQSNYRVYLHGEAVAIGMVMANKLAHKLGYMDIDECRRIENLLHSHNLPTSYIIDDVEKFYDTFFLDKKSTDNSIAFILPRGIGDFIITDSVDRSAVIEVLEEFQRGEM